MIKFSPERLLRVFDVGQATEDPLGNFLNTTGHIEEAEVSRLGTTLLAQDIVLVCKYQTSVFDTL